MKQLLSKERYRRQIALKEFGEEGQRKLQQSRILVVGAGGLGCPALLYLAAAGIGKLGIIDDDEVSVDNLHRQVLYTMDDVGLPKSERAALTLRRMNSDVEVVAHVLKVTGKNALELFSQYDIIIDGTDNFTSRYVINDGCALLNKPLVFAAIYQFEGQVSVFNVADHSGKKTNYRHIFPTPPSPGEAPSCTEAGVLGTLPGIIGMMQATEAIKLITGIGKPLVNRLLTYNALDADCTVFTLTGALPDEQLIPDAETFRRTDYERFCNGTDPDTERSNRERFEEFITDHDTILVDVREAGELPVPDFRHIHLPLSTLKRGGTSLESRPDKILPESKKIVVFCQSGVRSGEAVQILNDLFPGREISSLTGGLNSLKHFYE